ncbi:hypothetical protein HK103_007577 [Boothiomyces macroporosus]|uniref:Uncharacterized protein n=1 Tax=Boothiomyces macroporosus TaxID=261099 RepID=A0AAD5UFS3_9FUNG|nr:hypothetical protein HK103_007577 [Boothiomyces macroporosus]
MQVKKKQKTIEHAAGCNDTECKGCAVGEIDIHLTTQDGSKLSPHDIYYAAMEELEKQTLSEQDIDKQTHSSIVQKLFEMAVEEFERLQINDLVYAKCLYDMGVFLHVEDWFHQAEHELEKFLKSSKENSKNHEGWLLLGKVYLQIARARFKDDEETEQDEVEAENVHRAKRAFKQALELKDSPSYTLAASSAFLDHALLQKSHRLDSSIVINTLKTALKLTHNQHNRISGTCLFHLASIESHTLEPDLKRALSNVKKSIKMLEYPEKATDYQLLAQAWLLKSSLEVDDDDKAIEAFDEGAKCLQNALLIDPDNEHVKQQLIDMELIDDE